MPRFSTSRGVTLLTVTECAELAGRSKRTVWGWLKRPGVYVEHHQVETSAGNTVKTTFVDPATLPVKIPDSLIPAFELPANAAELDEDVVTAATLEEAAGLLLKVDDPSDRHRLVKLAAARFEVSRRTVYRWIKRAEQGIVKRQRSDAGRARIPQVARAALLGAFASNVPTTPTSTIYWIAQQAAPDALRYEGADGSERVVSLRSAHRLRQELMADPHTALMFADEDARKEYLRVYSGSVTAAHANELWEMDMTRCDIEVCDPETRQIFRPRVHAIIDVYSGCLMGVVFSKSEDQAQTDLVTYRSVVRKRGPYGDLWPMFGVPKRIYLDNGKVYTSEHFHRLAADLGIEVVHSLPKTSHTRGHIERFFQTLHNLERSLVGYVGRNAAQRSSETLKRLRRRTQKWLDGGSDPGAGDRLLTLTEYQDRFFAWLVSRYHSTVVDGLSRADHFAQTAPAETLLELDRNELALVFAKRVERVVDAAGRVRLDNRLWTTADGTLAQYQGYRVQVLSEPFALGDERLVIAFQTSNRQLEVVGEAVPAASVATSIEAQEQRQAAKAAVVAAARRARKQRDALADPRLRYDTQLLKSVDVTLPPAIQPTARAQLEAVNPTDAAEEEQFAPDDVIGQVIRARKQATSEGPDDPYERVKWLSSRHGGGEIK